MSFDGFDENTEFKPAEFKPGRKAGGPKKPDPSGESSPPMDPTTPPPLRPDVKPNRKGPKYRMKLRPNCERTGNPVGTDRWDLGDGVYCPCKTCHDWFLQVAQALKWLHPGKRDIGDWTVRKKGFGLTGRNKGKLWARSDRWVPLFFDALRKRGSPYIAAESAGVSYSTVKLRKQADQEFAAKYEEALEQHIASLEDVVNERAVVGPMHYAMHQGKRVPLGHKPSDLLLMFRVKKLVPAYKDSYNAQQVSAGDQAVAALVDYLKQPVATQIDLKGDEAVEALCEVMRNFQAQDIVTAVKAIADTKGIPGIDLPPPGPVEAFDMNQPIDADGNPL